MPVHSSSRRYTRLGRLINTPKMKNQGIMALACSSKGLVLTARENRYG